MATTRTRTQSPVTNPALYLYNPSIQDYLHQHHNGNLADFITESGIPRSTFYRAWKGDSLSADLIAQIAWFTQLPLAAFTRIEQRRRKSGR